MLTVKSNELYGGIIKIYDFIIDHCPSKLTINLILLPGDDLSLVADFVKICDNFQTTYKVEFTVNVSKEE